MAADTHGPTPKGLLCNAGAGAAAGKFFFFKKKKKLFCYLLFNPLFVSPMDHQILFRVLVDMFKTYIWTWNFYV